MTKNDLKDILLDMKNNKKTIHDYEEFNGLSKKTITRDLINLIKEDLENFSFDNANDLTYIFQIFDLLSYLIKDDKILQKQVIKMLTSFHEKIVNIIKNRPKELSKTARREYELLKNIVDKLEDTNLRLMYLPLDLYDEAKNKFIFYLIFEYKNYDLVKSSVELYPHIVNLRDNDGNIIEKVIDKYLSYLNKYLKNQNFLPQFAYYKDILKLILNDEKLEISTPDKKNYLKKIKKFANENIYTRKEEKEKFTYYINFLTLSLDGYDTSKFEDLDYEYDVSESFSNAIISEAYRIYLSLDKELSNDYYIVSFDEKGANEIDDALSIQKDGSDLILGVHIADITNDIKLSSIIDDEAFRRCKSIYIFDECIPMYPSILSSDKLSLIEKKTRPVFSYYFRFDMSKSTLKDFNVVKENICLSKNATYNEFDSALYKGSGDKTFVKLVYDLCQVSPITEKSFNKDSMYFEVNNCIGANLGQKVVANSMCFTSFNIAKWFFEKNIPFIYRNHTLSDEKLDRLKELKRNLLMLNNQKNEFNRILLNEYPKAFYSSECLGHYGLGIKCYGTVTSPLRKYSDSLAERAVDTFIINNYNDDDILFFKDLIDKTCKNISSRVHFNKMYEKAYAEKLIARRKK